MQDGLARKVGKASTTTDGQAATSTICPCMSATVYNSLKTLLGLIHKNMKASLWADYKQENRETFLSRLSQGHLCKDTNALLYRVVYTSTLSDRIVQLQASDARWGHESHDKSITVRTSLVSHS